MSVKSSAVKKKEVIDFDLLPENEPHQTILEQYKILSDKCDEVLKKIKQRKSKKNG